MAPENAVSCGRVGLFRLARLNQYRVGLVELQYTLRRVRTGCKKDEIGHMTVYAYASLSLGMHDTALFRRQDVN